MITQTSLKEILSPKSIAVIGASRDPASVGQGVLKNLVSGCFLDAGYCKPFLGKIYPVNPKADELLGLKCYPSVLAVPSSEKVDLAVVCLPSKIVPLVAEECGKKGVKALIVVSAGFAELGGEGLQLQENLSSICKKYGMRLIGPNCLGVIVPGNSLNASFAISSPPEGDVAFISQSGALVDSIIDWAVKERYSFSAIASLGNTADLDAADFIEWAANDAATKVITLYLEGVRDGKRFMRACAEATRKKPILLLKAGRLGEALKAVSSHTGALAGSYEVWLAAMRQSGVLVVDCVEDLFDLAKVLAEQPKLKQNSIAIITNGGGPGVLCTDYCQQFGLKLAPLAKETIAKLDATKLMHPAYSRRNPLDIVGDALPIRYEAALETILAESYIAGAIVIQTLQTMTDSMEDAKALVRVSKKHPQKPVISVFMGGKYSEESVRLLQQNSIPDFNDPKKAARAMAALGGLL